MTLEEAVLAQAEVAERLILGLGAEMLDVVTGVGISATDGDYFLRILLSEDDVLGIVRPIIETLRVLTPFDYVFSITGKFAFLNGPPIAAPGDRIRRGNNGSGTLGGIVQNGGRRFLLTCKHVLIGTGDIKVIKNGAPGPIIASGNCVQAIPSQPQPILADAAIAPLIGNLVSPAFPNGAVASSSVIEPKTGMAVEHFGVNGHRTATISDICTILNVNSDGRKFVFKQCALTPENFAERGDSGSLAIDTASRRCTGIVFAKASTADGHVHTAVCSLSAALAHFQAQLLIQ